MKKYRTTIIVISTIITANLIFTVIDSLILFRNVNIKYIAHFFTFLLIYTIIHYTCSAIFNNKKNAK